MRGTWIVVAAATVVLAGSSGPVEKPVAVHKVAAMTMQRVEVPMRATLSGEVRAQHEYDLAFRTSGRIVERLVDVGDHVTAGQLLARLDPQDLQANASLAAASVSAAEAQVEQARVTFERTQTLFQQGLTTRARFDQAEASLESAKAALTAAQSQKAAADAPKASAARRDGMGRERRLITRNSDAERPLPPRATIHAPGPRGKAPPAGRLRHFFRGPADGHGAAATPAGLGDLAMPAAPR